MTKRKEGDVNEENHCEICKQSDEIFAKLILKLTVVMCLMTLASFWIGTQVKP